MTKLPALTMLFLIILAPFSIADDVPDPEDDTITPQGAFQQPPPQNPPTMGAMSFGSGTPDTTSPHKVAPAPVNSLKLSDSALYTDLFSGGAQSSYTIKVPPGIQGFQPEVSMGYSHHSTGSPAAELGNSWSLNNNFIYRDTKFTRSNTADDIYHIHFNGIDEQLVYIPSENRYHTQHESFLYIKKESGASNTYGDYWIVKTKDGTEYRFGYTQESELASNLESYAVRWSLDRIKDTHDNGIVYTYREGLSASEKGVTYLSAITYGLNEIKFTYSPVPGSLTPKIYGDGIEILRERMLTSIVVLHDQQRVRQYDISYKVIGTKTLLEKITERGSDGAALPETVFSYIEPTTGWSSNAAWNVPPDAFFGSDKDQGVRLADIDGDGFVDIIKARDSARDLWKNNGNGFAAREQLSSNVPRFVDSEGFDQGARLLESKGDTKIDAVAAISGSMTFRTAMIENKGDGFSVSTFNIPSEVSFVEKIGSSQCTPPSCAAGFTDSGVGCSGNTCTRQCTALTCIGSGQVVFDATDTIEWDDDDYEEWEGRHFFYPQANKCYSFEFTGSTRDSGSGSRCYDLRTNDEYVDDDYDVDAYGRNLDAYAGLGFVGRGDSTTWLRTLPGEDTNGDGILDYGYTGNQISDAWEYKYVSKYGRDATPSSSSNGDWSGFNYAICDEAGTQAISCAPSQFACSLWGKQLCGYGCTGELTAPFVALGAYYRYDNDIRDALNDNEPEDSSDIMTDNDYFTGGRYRVTEYSTTPYVEQTQCSIYNYRDTGVRAIDVNSDGKTDLVKASPAERKTWINTGTSYVEDALWQIPSGMEFVTSNGKDNGVQAADVNGDGRVDLVRSDATVHQTWLNDGKGWKVSQYHTPPTAFSIDGQPQSTLADVNGDSLPDIIYAIPSGRLVWMNNGYTWTSDSRWTIPSSASLTDYSTQLVDINGDTTTDIVIARSSADRQTWLNNNQLPFLLKEVKTPAGGKVSVQYKRIAELDSTGSDNIHDLGFSGWVVDKITVDNGIAGSQRIESATQYAYEGGLFDADDREFRGFAFTKEILPDGEISHFFHQDDALKGAEYETIARDSSQRLFNKKEFSYTAAENSGIYAIHLDNVKESSYDASSIPRISEISFEYDDYGNVLQTNMKGDIAVTGDEKTQKNEFVYNEQLWIVDRQKRSILLDEKDDIVRERKFMYDAQQYAGTPMRGDMTKEIVIGEDNPAVEYAYDSFGNIIRITSPRGFETAYGYDSTHTFIEQATNALGQATRYEYNKGTGSLQTITDQNSYQTQYLQDSFGREVKVILPYDTAALPTIEYGYNFDGNAPEQIIMKYRERSNEQGTTDEHQYVDGIGNSIQSKKELNGYFAARKTSYDKRLRPEKQSNPYFSPISGYSDDASTDTLLSYDILGRVTKVKNPDGSEKEMEYAQERTIITDENNHRKEQYADVYGRILRIIEQNNGQQYTTTYAYTAADQLSEITNDKGEKIAYTYDTLGRKTAMDDPSLGRWEYEYDKSNNMIAQKDAKGNTIYFDYDELDRTKERRGQERVTYTYDQPTIGTLSVVQTPVFERRITYDNRLRKTAEDMSIAGQQFRTVWAYDAQDNVIEQQLPDNTVITKGYEDGSLASVQGVLDITITPTGQIEQRVYQNGLATSFSYDQMLRLTEIKTGNKQHKVYDYDPVGNVKTLADGGTSVQYSYDDIDRLVSAEKQGKYDMQYTYDSTGNVKSIDDAAYQIVLSYSSAQATQATIQGTTPFCTGTDGDNDGYVRAGFCGTLDCNDADNTIHPGAQEIACDNIDQDCSGADIGGTDSDNDGFKLDGGFCGVIDCDDGNGNINPGISEVCDAMDNNCNAQVDEGVLSLFYRDADSDFFGFIQQTTQACSAPTGYVIDSRDCNDNSAAENPAAAEICDGRDNNCNGQADEGGVCLQAFTNPRYVISGVSRPLYPASTTYAQWCKEKGFLTFDHVEISSNKARYTAKYDTIYYWSNGQYKSYKAWRKHSTAWYTGSRYPQKIYCKMR